LKGTVEFSHFTFRFERRNGAIFTGIKLNSFALRRHMLTIEHKPALPVLILGNVLWFSTKTSKYIPAAGGDSS
jgi:hypothetical protein